MKDLYHILFGRGKQIDTDAEKLIRNINVALDDIYHARVNFDMATGADNIELAIYELSTAEIKYRNLIKEARRLGIVKQVASIKKLKEAEVMEVDEDKCS